VFVISYLEASPEFVSSECSKIGSRNMQIRNVQPWSIALMKICGCTCNTPLRNTIHLTSPHLSSAQQYANYI